MLKLPTNEGLIILGRMTAKTHRLRFIANAVQDQNGKFGLVENH